MTPYRKTSIFALSLALCMAGIELYARSKVKTTPARQALARYLPDGGPHAVFLGSSLTDAGIRVEQLDSLLRVGAPGFRSFNLSLAGMSGSDNYYILFKNFILPRGRPEYLVVDAAAVPFLPPERRFKLEGNGLRLDSFRSELMEYRDLVYLANGFPGVAASISFWLNKHWLSYHYRLELQARIREKLAREESSTGSVNGSVNGSATGTRPGKGPYHMAGDAVERFAENTRKQMGRLAGMTDGTRAMRLREAHLLDLAGLARVNGVRLALLKPPCPPIDQVTAKVPVFAAYEKELHTLCDSLGIIYLDFSGEKSCGPYSFADGIHLDESGARAFTACVAGALENPVKVSAAPPPTSPAPAVP
jgi:hypothetical protein